MKRYYAFKELFLCRMRQFYREPEAIFWTYGFPILLTAGLGIAFRNRPPERVEVAVEDAPATQQIRELLTKDEGFKVKAGSADECARLLRLGDVEIVIAATETGYEYRYDPTRSETTILFFTAFLPMIPAIDRFFDDVLVMIDDVTLQQNRLGLLQRIAALANGVADMSRLEGF